MNPNNDNQNTEIKTYSGEIIISQDSIMVNDMLDLNFAEGSSSNGTFFKRSDGAVGIFSGSFSGNSLNFTGLMKYNPLSTFS